MTDPSPRTEPGDAATSPGWIQPISTPRAFEEILVQVERAVVEGDLAPGERLPSERELATSLRVSRTSVREALRVMETLGLLDIGRGRTGATLRSDPRNAFADILRLHVAFGHYSWESIIDLRAILEGWAFFQAATSPDNRLLDDLSAVLARMSRPGIEPAHFLELDVAFHSTVVDWNGNELVSGILSGCSSVIQKGMFQGITTRAWPETVTRLISDHTELYQHIQATEPQRASDCVREHIRSWNVPVANTQSVNRLVLGS